ncbi:hypothetical protein [Mycobacterium vicinigordonae]|nr:hypothetical protein [Mycobacterium vicinigordonae]
MSYSGKAVHRASATGGQEAFFERHVHTFGVLGGAAGDHSDVRIHGQPASGLTTKPPGHGPHRYLFQLFVLN